MGVSDTLSAMVSITRQYRKSMAIIDLAHWIVGACAGHAHGCEARALHAWVQRNIRYVMDVSGIETLSTPDVVLHRKSGDCDDQATLLGTLASSIGLAVRYVAIASQTAGEWDHVYAEVQLGMGKWYALETTECVPAGWAAPRVDHPIVRYV